MKRLREHWPLDESISFLNHGSFGACPTAVVEEQRRWQTLLEREPVHFFTRLFEDALESSRAEIADFLGASSDSIAFVRNATEGVNAVLRSIEWKSDDELIVLNHGYGACINAARHVTDRAGAKVVVANIPFPIAHPDEALASIMECVTPRTRLALIDHITSPTALVLPIERIVAALRAAGVETLVDGAHGPGMVELKLDDLGAAYYTGNLHKWCCAPKGAAILHVRSDCRDGLHPPVISHGFNSPRKRPRWLEEFDWVGTMDPSAWLTAPFAIQWMSELLPGGWEEIRATNRERAIRARDVVAAALRVSAPCPDSMIGSIASLPLPDGTAQTPVSSLYADALHTRLFEEHQIEIPVVPWPSPPKRLIRLSAQVYNEDKEYVRLARALTERLD